LTSDGGRPGRVSDPDVELMLAFSGGQEHAFVELYRKYRDPIVRFSLRMLGNRAEAEEAAQDVFLKLHRARASYHPRSRFSTFLYRIAANHCLNLRARLDRRLVDRDGQSERHAQGGADQHADLATKELRAALEAALAALPDRQRAALLLVHYEGLSYRDAAEAIEVSEPAIKSLIHRARGTLIERLGNVLPETEVEHAV
jgi:RNA polymerase sigma-70 factor (ECF subfamily)